MHVRHEHDHAHSLDAPLLLFFAGAPRGLDREELATAERARRPRPCSQPPVEAAAVEQMQAPEHPQIGRAHV